MRTLALTLFLAACGGPMPDSNPPHGGGRSPDHAPARDGDAAVREEFAAAEREGAAESYEQFALRHPDHPLASLARERAQALRNG